MKVTIRRKTHTATIKMSADEVDILLNILPNILDKILDSRGVEFVRDLRNSDLLKHCDYCGNYGARCDCEWMEN